MKNKKSNPSYLLKLGRDEGKKLADKLVSLNQDKIANGEMLTARQVQQATEITVKNLQNRNKIPKNITSGELEAFETPFVDELRRFGLF